MASPPQLQVDDQTDEDFFDKLVEDDFPGFEKYDFDEASAFSNLNLGEIGCSFHNSGGEDVINKVEANSSNALVDFHNERGNSLGKNNSSGFENVTEPNSDLIMTMEESLDLGTNKSISSGTSIKEVQWSAFNANTSQNGIDGFGSYSDFFTDLGGDSSEFPEKNKRDLSHAANILATTYKSHGPAMSHSYEQFSNEVNIVSPTDEPKTGGLTDSIRYEQYKNVDSSVNTQDPNSSQYWENLYPGWNYDTNTGQWYQVDGYDATETAQETFDVKSDVGNSETSYLQQTVQSVATTESVSSWNEASQGSNVYPDHMFFDPQYPGWYYDMIGQEWRTLETYDSSSVQHVVQSENTQTQNGFVSAGNYSHNHGLQGHIVQGQDNGWSGSYGNYNKQNPNAWQLESVNNSPHVSNFSRKQQSNNFYSPTVLLNNHMDQQKSFNVMGAVPLQENASVRNSNAHGSLGLQSYIHSGSVSQQYSQSYMNNNERVQFQHDYYANQNTDNFSRQPFQTQSNHQTLNASNTGRSYAGRPPHALVTFGFGGKLIVVRDNASSRDTSFGIQDPSGSTSIVVHNLMEVVNETTDASNVGLGLGDCNYIHTLCQQSFPGPLVGGSVGHKDLNKWIDEKISNCVAPGMDYRKGEALRLLLSLLKIAYQHYGKLRSPFGTDTASRENESPESAVAELFASAKRIGGQMNAYGAVSHCLHNFPSEGQILTTASEVQSLLVSGKTKEALRCAQEGQLWGPALVLAAQLGDQFYVNTVKQMALRQLVAGSPLRTLCLLIAGQHADVFSTDVVNNSFPAVADIPQQSGQLGVNVMLDNWDENLAVITANRTKDDCLVMMHLGDCLWKERSEIIPAHICYLVAEADFQEYSDTARLCLIGADHWKFPRTFASPEAIQRTELFEYAKVLGNSQFILPSLQPYKLLYAHMLAEVGKVSDALKYCQTVSKSLKNARTPELEMCKQLVSSLEDRLRTYQQGGFTANLAPKKLVGKLLNLFDTTAHRVVGGGLPPTVPLSQTNVQENGHFNPMMGPRVSTSQSTMAMSSLMPSDSMEPISEWTSDGNRKAIHNRSVSEPDFNRTPRQTDSSKEDAASAQGKTSRPGSLSRFSFGSQLFQRVGQVLKRGEKQAKLGEKNKFYYDEKLKRWVEEGADPPAEAATPQPPPTTSSFQNGMSDFTSKSSLHSEGLSSDIKSPPDLNSGIPPMPPSSNQFSARGRTGVRSRYVDTFNSGIPTNLFQTPSVPSIRSTIGNSPKFLIPSAETSSSVEQKVDSSTENVVESSGTNSDEIHSPNQYNGHSPDQYNGHSPDQYNGHSPDQCYTHPPTMGRQRFPSMSNIPNQALAPSPNSSFSGSRRTASWSGSFSDTYNHQNAESSTFMPSSLGEDLHEVEL